MFFVGVSRSVCVTRKGDGCCVFPQHRARVLVMLEHNTGIAINHNQFVTAEASRQCEGRVPNVTKSKSEECDEVVNYLRDRPM
jgi:enhancing lycopene biosynthesis protein 2